MEKYCVHYYDENLTLHYQAIEIETDNIGAWVENFKKNQNITVMEIDNL